MKAWKGKIIGALLGMLTRRPQFILLGIVLGHFYDMGIFSKQPNAPQDLSDARDAYQVLGVDAQASMAEIDTAYRRKMSDYHPDKVANAADEIKALAETRAREINAAYETLRKLHANR